MQIYLVLITSKHMTEKSYKCSTVLKKYILVVLLWIGTQNTPSSIVEDLGKYFNLSHFTSSIHYKISRRWKGQSGNWLCLFVCLYVCLFITARSIFRLYGVCYITGDRAANLDLCLALMGFSSKGSFTRYTCCDTHGISVFKIISERPVILTSKCWVVLRRSHHYLF
jgi:hypothetical protein